MEIIRIEENVGKSMINNRRLVEDLPEGIKSMIVEILNKLEGVLLIVTSKGKDRSLIIVLRYQNKNIFFEELPPEIRGSFRETIELLEWYLGSHWYSLSLRGTMGAPLYCIDCQRTVRSGHSGPCPNENCPSHCKWKKVIGPCSEIDVTNPLEDFRKRLFRQRKCNCS